jgi:polyhydroxyalkanoate synthesis repressor PhaR
VGLRQADKWPDGAGLGLRRQNSDFSLGAKAISCRCAVRGDHRRQPAGGEMADQMAAKKEPTIIKKYANRRLYHTGTSTYVTLEDLAVMVKQGEDFLVSDAKSGEDITRSVLTQIIFEQEGKEGQSLLPISFLRQLIRFYGDSMQTLVPSYLEFSLERFTGDQQKMRDMMSKAFGSAALEAMGDQVRTNMTMFQKALGMFAPFKYPGQSEAPPAAGKDDVDALKKELDQLRSRLDRISKG